MLVLAKHQRLIPACAPLLAALREQGYYLSDALVAAVLAEVGEASGPGRLGANPLG